MIDQLDRFRTRVHIADMEVGLRQRCFRCGALLVNGENAASINGQGMLFWPVGKFIGVTERIDGERMNPTMSVLMERDAEAADEIRCDL